MYSTLLMTALVAFAANQAGPVRQTLESSSMLTKTGKSDCMAGGKTKDGSSVYFGVGIDDNTFTLAATRSNWDIVNGQNTDATDIPIRIKFADGAETTSPYGGYKNGFAQGVWGTWHGKKKGTEADSLAAFEMMRANGSAEIYLNGKAIEKVDFGIPGMAYQWIKSCLVQERKNR